MSTLTAIAPTVKHAPALENPRDAWPAWTDADRWELTEDDDPRPTARPDFNPTAEEEAEAAGLLNCDDESDDACWDARAEDAYAMDRACFGPVL